MIQMGGEMVDIPGEMSRMSTTPLRGKRARLTWIRQYILHKTIADDPEKIVAGGGPPGGADQTIKDWWDNPDNVDGAAMITDYDGTIVGLVDVENIETFHATVSNAWSIGHETKEKPGGYVYRAQLYSTVATCLFVCRRVGIQLQMPKLGSYTGHPIPRMTNGGPDMIGIFGHRDNTEARGRWDPGDELFAMLAAQGVEQLDFAAGEDLDVWAKRQQMLNQETDAGLTHDGVPGPKTLAALKKAGYVDGIWALGRQQ